ncbi:MAG: hypothetical protein ABSH03_09270 [Candidatus Lustribacter sp.]
MAVSDAEQELGVGQAALIALVSPYTMPRAKKTEVAGGAAGLEAHRRN